ncbi:symmetrical bis(5'-nucleosyl)-tetraphosphatase [Hydrocarboniclastica marina]|uniref:bis(5'-nucleosyl)-tetraphosphatase (symmetrical) n=1 Tax=Hydrocarboniclastica marina TaxID=2259620 RepID=A0A4P7XJG2_9ALTE|nr:symmetrical bis(5'-nucleosyl)-tetraphosphatase [Hydrocarboniclastica marina]QCF27256.1 symmetrical bis(5'-nucleosyl)-tetraphosphatase [Hydrocarboniclastica marina]
MTDYAVGDIQGCYEPLQRVLEKVGFDPAQDCLWVVGDIINRGPESLQSLRFVRSLGSSARVVLGNHDLHLLALVFNNQQPKRKDTLEQILEAADAVDLIDWLRMQPLAYYDLDRDLFMSHAGLPHIWSVPQALAYATEVSAVIGSSDAHAYFEHMYGNQPERWSSALTGTDRWRVITNYLTRMRFIAADGTLELTAKEDGNTGPAGFQPWFSYPRPQDQTRVVFGHWAALKGETQSERFIGLDTGCVWGGAMTLMNLDTGERSSCDCGR